MFLTQDQIEVITGYKRPGRQIRVLTDLKIPFLVSASGFPVVAIREVERRLMKDPKIHAKDRPRLEMVK